jgi:hypothetical protein
VPLDKGLETVGKKSTPKAPDPYKVSAAQTESNKETAEYNAALNRINQSSPFGSITYSQSGTDPNSGAPIYSQQTSLSPQMQQLLDSQVGAQQGISNAISGAIGRLPNDPFNPNIDVGDIRQRSFDSQMATLAPKFEEGWRNLETTMSDRGIPIGAEIWNNENNRFDTARDSSILAASRQADLDASNEYQRQYGNAMTEYNLPLQQLSALMGNSQGVQNPTFSPFATSQAAGTDVSGNVWNAYNADLQNSQNQQSALMGGLLGLGKLGVSAYSAGMFSDIRLKRDIKRIGEMASGLPIYSYRYVWSDEPQIGVMAQEALRVKPEAVMLHPSGYLMVNYGLL